MTEFISLDFIEWPFILTYLLFMVILYGIYNYYSWQTIDNLDLLADNHVSETYSDSIQQKMGIPAEKKMAFLLIGTLSLLLMLLFLAIDVNSLFFKAENGLTHSEYVHQGINVLIVSIIFVILIVTYVFRGQLNFLISGHLKFLTYFWLGLNLILTGFNFSKNYSYIDNWGLTHKRIGVYIYLALCVIGLTITNL